MYKTIGPSHVQTHRPPSSTTRATFVHGAPKRSVRFSANDVSMSAPWYVPARMTSGRTLTGHPTSGSSSPVTISLAQWSVRTDSNSQLTLSRFEPVTSIISHRQQQPNPTTPKPNNNQKHQNPTPTNPTTPKRNNNQTQQDRKLTPPKPNNNQTQQDRKLTPPKRNNNQTQQDRKLTPPKRNNNQTQQDRKLTPPKRNNNQTQQQQNSTTSKNQKLKK
ncbi:hypothetical protein Btru_069365 [Bulinus truncatus]|nr:hypothetical protein Btru_069365 [Bulinus truncatus]